MITNNLEFEKLTEVEEKINDLLQLLKYSVETSVKKEVLHELERIEEEINKNRRKYQQKKFNYLKTA